MRFKTFFRGLALVPAVFVVSVFIFSAGAFAAPVETVTNVNDMGAGSLREAIANVDSGGTVNFNIPGPGPHTIVLATEIVIDESMTIEGPGADTVRISGNDSVRIFNITDGEEDTDKVVSISGLRFINGFADVESTIDGGGAIKNEEELSIDSCVFEDNKASSDVVPVGGGAILNNGTLTYLTHSTFTDNEANSVEAADSGLGGAILNTVQIFQIYKCTFNGNTATSTDGAAGGGAIHNVGIIQAIEEAEFSGNSVSSLNGIGAGGAIGNSEQIHLIKKSTFSGNTATSTNNTAGGGAIFSVAGGLIDEITYTDFSGNIATSVAGAAAGGAIVNDGDIGEVRYSGFIGNMATSESGDALGGAILNNTNSTITTIFYSTFSGNKATSEVSAGGGAVYNDGQIDDIAECAFSDNEAATETETGPGGTAVGGAIGNDGELIKIARTIFNGNIASTTSDSSSSGTFASGGAIHNTLTLDFIKNSTFYGNTAVATAGFATGGAINNFDFENELNISFVTVTNNSVAADDPADASGGGIFDDDNSILIRNSIVAFNTGGNCNTDIATEPTETNNYSDNGDCGFDFDNADIQLGPLADNGGPTKTVALIGGDPVDGASPDCDALDNPGVTVTEDQRGIVRPMPEGGRCDSGAFEVGFFKVEIRKVSIPSGGTGFPFSGSAGFTDGLPDCEITQDFILDDQDSASCVVPAGDYTITEHLGAGEVVSIFCEQKAIDLSYSMYLESPLPLGRFMTDIEVVNLKNDLSGEFIFYSVRIDVPSASNLWGVYVILSQSGQNALVVDGDRNKDGFEFANLLVGGKFVLHKTHNSAISGGMDLILPTAYKDNLGRLQNILLYRKNFPTNLQGAYTVTPYISAAAWKGIFNVQGSVGTDWVLNAGKLEGNDMEFRVKYGAATGVNIPTLTSPSLFAEFNGYSLLTANETKKMQLFIAAGFRFGRKYSPGFTIQVPITGPDEQISSMSLGFDFQVRL